MRRDRQPVRGSSGKGGELEVYAFDASQPHVDAINRSGLRLSGAADLHVRSEGQHRRRRLPICDYGIVATKAIHTASAIKAAARCFDGAARCARCKTALATRRSSPST